MATELAGVACIRHVNDLLASLTTATRAQQLAATNSPTRPSAVDEDEPDKESPGPEEEDDSAEYETPTTTEKEQRLSPAPDAANVNADWLRSCVIRLSSDALLMAVSSGAAVLLLKKDTRSGLNDFGVVAHCLPDDEGDLVSDVIIFPLPSRKANAETSHCVVAGYRSGYVRFFSEDGRQRHSQMLHVGAVARLRLQRHDLMYDLAVLYSKAIVIVDALSVLQCVRTGPGPSSSSSSSAPGADGHLTLSIRKWGLDGGSSCVDVACTGLVLPTAYDHLVTHPEKQLESIYQYITVGKLPVVAVYTTAGVDRPTFSPAALAASVASKVGSVVFSVATSFWGKKSSASADQQAGGAGGSGSGGSGGGSGGKDEHGKLPASAAEPCTPLPLFCAFKDPRRAAQSVSVDPTGQMAVVCDGFGRVLLMEVSTCTVVRIWKGYRDAQCGWVHSVAEDDEPDTPLSPLAGGRVSSEPTPQHHRSPAGRSSVFLVIFAPRRGLLEVWSTRLGSRVGAFNVGLNCTLLSIDGHPLSSAAPSVAAAGGRHGPRDLCVLLRATGELVQIRVPFVCALSNTVSAKGRDRQALRKLDHMLQKMAQAGPSANTAEQDERSKACLQLLKGLQSPSSIRQAFLLLGGVELPTDFVRSGHALLSAAVASMSSASANTVSPSELQALRALANRRTRQLEAYDAFRALYPTVAAVPTLLQPSAVRLTICGLPPTELAAMEASFAQLLTDATAAANSTTAPNAAAGDVSLAQFLAALQTPAGLQGDGGEGSGGGSSSLLLELRPSLADEERARLAAFCFRCMASGYYNVNRLVKAFALMGLLPSEQLVLLHAWLATLPVATLLHPSVLEALHSYLRAQAVAVQTAPSAATAGKVGVVGAASGAGGSVASVAAAGVGAVVPAVGAVVAGRPIGEAQSCAEWWNALYLIGYESQQVAQALTLSLLALGILRALRSETGVTGASGNTNTGSVAADSLAALYRDMDPQWACLVERLLDLLCLTRVTRTAATATAGETTAAADAPGSGALALVVSVETALNQQRVYELVVLHLLDMGLSPAVLASMSGRSPAAAAAGDAEQTTKALVAKCKAMQARFPATMHPDALAARCAWHLCDRWAREPERSMRQLAIAGEFLQLVRSGWLRMRLAAALWERYLQGVLAKVVELMEKTDKAPKDSMLKRHLSIGTEHVKAVLALAVQLLTDLSSESAAVAASGSAKDTTSAGGARPMLGPQLADQRWPCTAVQSEAVEAAHLASVFCQIGEREAAEPGLVGLHVVLARVALTILQTDMRGVKPRQLFPTAVQATLFAPLESRSHVAALQQAQASTSDDVVAARLRFMTKALSAAVWAEPESAPAAAAASGGPGLGCAVADVLALCDALRVDAEETRLCHVRSLLEVGRAVETEDICVRVKSRDALASIFVSVIRNHLHDQLTDASDPQAQGRLVSELPTDLHDWLLAAEPSPRQRPGHKLPLSKLPALLQRCLRFLPEASPEARHMLQLNTVFTHLIA
eukprot:m.153284 g.153284  ORF g.153284 m.153284 type:complete len:1506 (-) comp16937_c3_seq1:961-5478(-)